MARCCSCCRARPATTGRNCNVASSRLGAVLDRLAANYRLVCVNFDGFDGGGSIFPDKLTVTEKIERYIWERYDGRIDGAIRRGAVYRPCA